MMADKTCIEENCSGKPIARGLCNAHYKRLRRHGSAAEGRTPPGTALRFLGDVIKKDWPEQCVSWPFTCDDKGYARVHYKGSTALAYRVSCEWAHGPSPSRLHEAAHSCGKGHLGCVNPKHLRWATRKENHQDKLVHGTDFRGEKSPSAKLSSVEVSEIRAAVGKERGRDLARKYGVSPATICNIQKGATWSWL